MMFILRTVFWLSLVVLILPTDARQQEQITNKLVSTVHHVATFCDRNAKACTTGAHYWDLFQQKAEYGFQLALTVIANQMGSDERDDNGGASVQSTSKNTLRRDDLGPAWRGNLSNNRI